MEMGEHLMSEHLTSLGRGGLRFISSYFKGVEPVAPKAVAAKVSALQLPVGTKFMPLVFASTTVIR